MHMKSVMKKGSLGFMAVAMMLLLGACGKNADQHGNTEADQPVNTEEKIIATDYSDDSNWIAHPENGTKPVDTIYLYPTAFIDASEGAAVICDVDDESMRQMAQGHYDSQATVYEESTNVYAPYYRQVNLAAVSGMPTDERDALSAGIPQTDVFAALDHYFAEDNEGRPFILAGHSQGSQMLTNVLSKYMGEHPEYLDRMVAAYVIGYSVTDDFLAENPHLKFAAGETDTGVIVSWNTEGPDNKEQDSFVILPGAQCINPLNWKRDDTYAGADLNIGARILNQDTGEYEAVPEAADAVIDLERGVIVTTTTAIEPVQAAGFGTDSFHNGDYSLYYYNLRENVEKRCKAYFATQLTGDGFTIRPLEGEATDYTEDDNWMLIDKLPEKDVDLFYIYPTVYDKEGGTDFAEIDDPLVRTLAQLVYSKTGSAIGELTNVYAPYYRQTNLSKASEMKYDEYTEFNMGLPRTDIYAALDEYFENYNEGRPFVLAGHSQGSCMIKIILGEYMQAHPEYLDRMIAAYAVGFSITEDWLLEHPYLKFAEGADDTGVIISWNAEGAGNKNAGETLIVREGAISINPITWTRSGEKADASRNLGSRTIDMEKALAGIKDGSVTTVDDMNALWETTVPGTADAQVDTERGTVICTTSDDFNENEDIFGPESFHSHDYDFYYVNIRENAKERIAAYLSKEDEKPVDYSVKESWYKLPEITKEADTFFIYPTVYCDFAEGAPDYAPLHDEMMMSGVEDVYHTQACVFEESTNLFIPYYRQANITAEIEAAEKDGDIQSSLEGHYPEFDINAALDYYFENYNEERPFIIAGHSQGAAMTRLVLKNYFGEHPEYYERMVAAYVIGYSITKEDLKEHPYLKFAEGGSDTGVIVSWNTEGSGNKNANNIVVLDGAISINPLNWKPDDTYASAQENLGSRVKDVKTGKIEYEDIGADARLDTNRGVVICNADYPFIGEMSAFDSAAIFGKESFHNGDYTFYFDNIKKNVADRINAYNTNGGN